jgi:hypothetical protein
MRDRAARNNIADAIRSRADEDRRTGFDVRGNGVYRFGVRSDLGFLSFLGHCQRF